MKYLIIIFLQASTFILNGQEITTEDFINEANQFFKNHVKNDLVDYQNIHKDSSSIYKLTTLIQQIEIKNDPPQMQKAFWINAYNLLVIKNIIANYPVKSPMDIPGFFDRQKHTVSNQSLTLNDIENKIIRTQFKDARIHFVLVCGAIGCPPITNFAYTPPLLEKQIDIQTKLAINNKDFIKIDEANKKASISEIFQWYESDFLEEAESIKDYINKYRNKKIPNEYSIDYYSYDWNLNEFKLESSGDKGSIIPQSNLRAYTPAILLKKGQVEVQLYNNIYTQTAYRNTSGKKVDLNSRQTYYTGLFHILFGVSESSRINIGMDINIKSVRNDPDPNSSFLKIFPLGNTDISRSEIASVGPKIKISPFKGISNFSIQSAFWIPLAKDMEGTNIGKPWLDYDRYTWWTQFFFDKMVGSNFQLFTEADLLFRFQKDFEFKQTRLETPLSAFLSYFPSPKTIIFGNVQYAPLITDLPDYYFKAGFGAKYQLTSNIGIEIAYSNFLLSNNAGAGQTFDLGIRFIK